MSTAIVWFRQDLRTQDNPALTAACRHHETILPLYIAPNEPKQAVGEAQCWWLHHALEALDMSLSIKNLRLCLRRGDALSELRFLIERHQVDAVYWNRCYEPNAIARDQLIKAQLKEQGLTVNSFNGSLLNEPWTIKNKSQGYFKVFTPYWKTALQLTQVPDFEVINQWPNCPSFESEKLTDWNLLPTAPNWAASFRDFWQPGETGALTKLTDFIDNHLSDYKQSRDIPYQSATSRLSPHLHFGEISPWQVWRAIEVAKQDPRCDLASAEHFLRELGWREFSYHLLYHVPQLPTANFRSEFDAFPWADDKMALTRWQKGLTGYPIVDAGMRELWQTGYMHNRVRMITASFLIKHLLIDWRLGADWFYNTLLDADLANNSASWQWVAGSGADAAPYFRIFNPILQGEKFDPKGLYVKRFIPELAGLSEKYIHQPWLAPDHQRLILKYPKPIVDHTAARARALAAFQTLKNQS